MVKYDYLIVGSGLFGATFAYMKKKQNKKCLIIDQRSHVGGNVFTKNIKGIDIHVFGPHIFNTSNLEIWQLVNKLCAMNPFQHEPKAKFKDKLYTIPFNLNTISEIFNISNPSEAKKFIESKKIKINNPQNLEEFALSQLGEEMYEKLIYGYTKKQWNKDPKELPAFIIKRLPIRFNFNNSYYNTKYQGIPNNGYTELINAFIEGVECHNDIEFKLKDNWYSIAKKIVYTGPIDQLFDYRFGELEYRSLRFEDELIEIEDFQGTAIVNHTDLTVDYTRIVEHKHFNPYKKSKQTIITYEYPQNYIAGVNTPYYPVNTQENDDIYKKYRDIANQHQDMLVSGRLGLFKYLNMDQVISIAMSEAIRF